MQHLVQFLQEQKEPLQSQAIRQIIRDVPAYAQVPRLELVGHLQELSEVLLDMIITKKTQELQKTLKPIVRKRAAQGFPLSSIHAAFAASFSCIQSLLLDTYLPLQEEKSMLQKMISDLSYCHTQTHLIASELIIERATSTIEQPGISMNFLKPKLHPHPHKLLVFWG